MLQNRESKFDQKACRFGYDHVISPADKMEIPTSASAPSMFSLSIGQKVDPWTYFRTILQTVLQCRVLDITWRSKCLFQRLKAEKMSGMKNLNFSFREPRDRGNHRTEYQVSLQWIIDAIFCGSSLTGRTICSAFSWRQGFCVQNKCANLRQGY